jgi:hypothetical protein
VVFATFSAAFLDKIRSRTMAKTIKFNLIIDNKPIRSLDDLRENFNINDILGAYHNGSLKRWLETRDSANEIAALEKITGDDIEAALELCRIFNKDCTKEQLETAAYPFEFKQKEAEKLRQYKNLKEQKDEVIRAYHGAYEKILKELESNSYNYSYVKLGVAEIYKNYIGLYQLDSQAFYGRFIQDHPLLILAMLANANMRPLIAKQPEEMIYKDLDINSLTSPHFSDSDIKAALEKHGQNNFLSVSKETKNTTENLQLKKKKIPILILAYQEHPDLNGNILYSNELPDSSLSLTYVPIDEICAPINHVKTFAGETETYWKDIQPKDRQFLIIKMEKGNFVRNFGKMDEELNAESVNGKFPILNGINYQSNNANHKLVYMEV